MNHKSRKYLKRAGWTAASAFVLLNVTTAFHAYKFTHFSTETGLQKTTSEEKIGFLEKLKILFTGIKLPRPVATRQPSRPYETIYLQSNKQIECWMIHPDTPAKGTVILFHGYGGEKSSMLDRAEVLLQRGYNTLLVDFMGSGGSEGNQTTVGFREAEEVKTAFEYLHQSGIKNIFLFGTSMGAAAVLKAMHDYNLQPEGILLECPFGTMYETVAARCRMLKVPAFPIAGMLVFWGGIENGFRAFDNNPEDFARSVHCPVLLMYGEKDEKVCRSEIDKIYNNLPGQKTLKTFPRARHESYLLKYRNAWTSNVQQFLEQCTPAATYDKKMTH
ncbi:alpha/beta hydrolase [Chitinophagaceae bacterium MMS25-I14]